MRNRVPMMRDPKMRTRRRFQTCLEKLLKGNIPDTRLTKGVEHVNPQSQRVNQFQRRKHCQGPPQRMTSQV